MTLQDAITAAADLIGQSKRLAVLTGAGVSKESGVPTFRDALDGLWARYDPAELATSEAYLRNPKLVWDWYEYRREIARQARPNPGHYALAALETLLPQAVIITQNVDNLHQQAGSSDIVALHGALFGSRCFANCQGAPTPVDVAQLAYEDYPRCPHCGVGVRPDVVWFGEALPSEQLARAYRLSEQADVMLVVGTSGAVQPAASLPFLAKRRGAKVVEVNPVQSEITAIADVWLQGPSGEVLPPVVAAIRAQRGHSVAERDA